VNIYILHLSLIDRVGPATIQTLVQKKPTSCSWPDLYQASQSDLITLFGLSSTIAQKVYSGLKDEALLEKELALIERHAVKVITLDDQTYPELLSYIYAPPAVLYMRGADFDTQRCLAVVGSRKANYYGQRIINQLVPELVTYGFTIVSGGALGADSMAHKATIAAGGKTVVVLGSGLLEPYPHTNKGLFDSVVSHGGAILSSFPLQTEAIPGNFPARNRIVAGLSKGCIVVQAAERSGASITANYALDQGREVFAVPGPIDDELSVGCHTLIQQGATLLSKPQDILNAFNYTYPASPQTNIPVQQNLTVSVPEHNDTISRIIQSCRIPCAIDELVVKTGLDLTEIQDILFNLQLEGKVEQDFSGMWNSR
jgi:DNA processing protein